MEELLFRWLAKFKSLKMLQVHSRNSAKNLGLKPFEQPVIVMVVTLCRANTWFERQTS